MEYRFTHWRHYDRALRLIGWSDEEIRGIRRSGYFARAEAALLAHEQGQLPTQPLASAAHNASSAHNASFRSISTIVSLSRSSSNADPSPPPSPSPRHRDSTSTAQHARAYGGPQIARKLFGSVCALFHRLFRFASAVLSWTVIYPVRALFFIAVLTLLLIGFAAAAWKNKWQLVEWVVAQLRKLWDKLWHKLWHKLFSAAPEAADASSHDDTILANSTVTDHVDDEPVCAPDDYDETYTANGADSYSTTGQEEHSAFSLGTWVYVIMIMIVVIRVITSHMVLRCKAFDSDAEVSRLCARNRELEDRLRTVMENHHSSQQANAVLEAEVLELQSKVTRLEGALSMEQGKAGMLADQNTDMRIMMACSHSLNNGNLASPTWEGWRHDPRNPAYTPHSSTNVPVDGLAAPLPPLTDADV